MKKCICKLKSVSPYSQSRYLQEKKSRDETHQEFEKRMWIERAHWHASGCLQIPPMSFKLALSEAAKYKSIQIPGKGKSTYTKHCESGILVVEPLLLKNITRENIDHEWLHVPSDGRRGGTTRVEKCFPLVHEWSGTVEYLVLDEILTEDVMRMFIADSGAFIGIGRFRPRNNGFYGRFELVDMKFE